MGGSMPSIFKGANVLSRAVEPKNFTSDDPPRVHNYNADLFNSDDEDEE